MSEDRGRAWVAVGAMALLAALALLGLARGRVARDAADPSSGAAAVAGGLAATGDGPSAGGPAASAATRAYVVQAGDTLSVIAARFSTSVAALMEANGIADPDAIFVGQELRLQIVPSGVGPSLAVLPDGELVYGPAHLDFDVASFVAARSGPLADYGEMVNGETLTGAEIVARVARDFSVGPRVLLAFVEARSGWVTGAAPADAAGADYPAGLDDPMRSGLWLQLNWLADRLNGGYYDWKTRDNRILTLRDGTFLSGHPTLGPGSFAVHRALGLQATESELEPRAQAFDAAYRALFGDPWARAAAAPVGTAFPDLQLPWAKGELWWLTGGPHGGWASGSAWSAIDFVPDGDALGCAVAGAWTTAVADGVVIGGSDGQLWLDLDGDMRRETGPVVFYLHLAAEGRAAHGTRVSAGDRLGHPSCEGGASSATHVHVARLLDGEWLAAEGPTPFRMGGWTVTGAAPAYDGGLRHSDGRERTACECRQEGYNDVAW